MPSGSRPEPFVCRLEQGRDREKNRTYQSMPFGFRRSTWQTSFRVRDYPPHFSGSARSNRQTPRPVLQRVQRQEQAAAETSCQPFPFSPEPFTTERKTEKHEQERHIP